MAAVTAKRKARPARFRIRLWDAEPPGAISLVLPERSMRAVSIILAISFVIFVAIEWTTVAGLFGRRVDDVFDLTFLVFQAFWAFGWSVGVLILGALTIVTWLWLGGKEEAPTDRR